MAPSRRAAAASNTATRVKKVASSSKPSTKAKAKGSNKRTRNRKDLSKSNARPQVVKQAAPSGLAGGSSNASGHNNGRKSNSQRATGVAVKNTPRRTTAAKSGSQAQPQRNSGRKHKTQRLTGVSAKSAPLKPTRRFNAEAAGNRKQTQNSKKTKSSIKAGRQAGAAKQQSPRKVGVQSKENGHVKAPLGGKAKKAVVSPRKSAGTATTPRTGRKRKAPEEDPAIMGDKNVEMVPTDTRVEPVRLPLVKTEGSLYKCCVPGCPSTDDEFFTGLWLFALPTDEAVRTTWLEKIHVDPEINRPLSPRVCFQHFEKEDFVARNRCFIGLSGSALPRDIPRHMYRY
ncbi:uncharacterized protein LOC144100896 isoform X2 [Amblyomma americanum]